MLKKLLQYVRTEKIGLLATVVGMITVTFFLQTKTCPCTGRTFECNEIIVVPVFLVFFLMLLIDQTFRSTAKHPSTFLCLVVKRVIRAFLISLLWIVAVLLVTDWYGCCNIDENTSKLFCKSGNFTTEQQARKDEVEIKSKLAGYSLLLGMTVVAFFMTWSGWRKWFVKKYSCCNKKTFYYKLILEEEKKVLEELLRKEANETLTKEIMSNIKRKDWDGCLNVAQQMINKAKHQKPEATNQQINWISEGSSNRGGQHHQAAAHQQAQNYELDAVAQVVAKPRMGAWQTQYWARQGPVGCHVEGAVGSVTPTAGRTARPDRAPQTIERLAAHIGSTTATRDA
ncbi:uncharacterized protein LOC109196249 isoform X1 [Oreochromis niloticus]|uniref:uncharacterized protein LOC109196249 isoform X1 n=1 Tax=Oreochromis niloticus TaxID=8128 RepID=UPI000904DE54|nr:uncharacterized protein LOC109196249 isoform X1 [Oreochromis niloticus]